MERSHLVNNINILPLRLTVGQWSLKPRIEVRILEGQPIHGVKYNMRSYSLLRWERERQIRQEIVEAICPKDDFPEDLDIPDIYGMDAWEREIDPEFDLVIKRELMRA